MSSMALLNYVSRVGLMFALLMTTNLENMENLENSGKLKNCQNVRENSGKIWIFAEKPEKLRGDVKCVS